MAFWYGKLRGRIIEKYGSNKAFAEAMGISEASVSSKLSNGASFFQSQITKACYLLDIPKEEVGAYFFTEDVQKSEQR